MKEDEMSEKCVHEWYYRIVGILDWQFFCIRCGEKLSMDKFSNHASDLEKRMAELGKATACIAELEEQVWNLNLENERLEEAYWIDETISPDGTLKPSVRKLLERLEKAETDLRLSDDLVKALDNRIAELEAERDDWRIIADGEMPDDRATVLVAFTEYPEQIDILTATYYKRYEGFGGVDNWWKIEGWHSGNVTHWMPLPQPPEERER